MTSFVFQKFRKEDYNEYNQWFEDEALKKALTGIDEEWLSYILADERRNGISHI